MTYNATMAKDYRINFRITGKNAEKFAIVYDRVMAETKNQAKMTTIVLELMGLEPPFLTTEADRRFLQHGTDAPVVPEDEVRQRLLSLSKQEKGSRKKRA